MSGVGFSIQSCVIRLLAEKGFHGSFFCVLMRGLTQGLIASMFIYFDENRHKPDGKPLFGDSIFIKIMLFLRAVIGYGSIACSFLAAEYISIGDSTVLIMLSPMIASIASYFILGESWRWPELTATILSLAGAVLVAKPPFIFGHQHQDNANITSHDMFLGVTLGLSAALFAGFAFICVRILGTSAKMPWANVCFSQALAQVILSIPNQYIAGQRFEDIFTITAYEGGLIFLGGFIGAWSQISMTLGMQREKSATATAMRMSDVVFGFIWQILFTQDPISVLSIMGAILVTGSIMVVVVFKQSGTAQGASQDVKKAIRPEIELSEMDSSAHNILHNADYLGVDDEDDNIPKHNDELDEYWLEDEDNDIEARVKKIAAYLKQEGASQHEVTKSPLNYKVANQTEHAMMNSPLSGSGYVKGMEDIAISPVLGGHVNSDGRSFGKGSKYTNVASSSPSNDAGRHGGGDGYGRVLGTEEDDIEGEEDLEQSTHEINLSYNDIPYSDTEA